MKSSYFALFALLSLCSCGTPEGETSSEVVVDVQVARAETADVNITILAPARLFPREQANISSRITAPIRRLLVRKGDRVSKNQLLAELENRDLLAQREEAAAAVTDANAYLQRTTSGTLPTDIERARGQLASAEAALKQAEKIHERRQQLFEQGAIPNREVLISQTDLAKAKADYDVAQTALDLLENKSREEDIRMARSRLQQAEARLGLIQTQLQFTEIRSPFAGAVTEQFLYPGDMTKPDSPLFTVMDVAVVMARTQVPEDQARVLRTGQTCKFHSADNEKAALEGRLTMVNQAVDPARRTVEAWCEVPNSGQSLRAGEFGTTEVIVGKDPNSVIVPVQAVEFVEGTSRGSVMIVGSTGTAARREVETGERLDDKIQITKGLNAGDLVIVEGGYGLPDGTQVRYQEGQQR